MFVLNKFAKTMGGVWEMRDRRLSHLPFMDSPLPFAMVLVGYIYATRIGPQLMASRKPFNIKRIIIVYNIIQILLNGAFSIRLWQFAFGDKFDFACQPIVWGDSSDAIFLAFCSYSYFLLKLLDFGDTLFFVLRKKSEHISFLHVYHHSVVSFGTYLQAIFAPAGQTFVIGAINTFIHAVMYTYYLVTILKPEIRANVGIKKVITRMQMVQFGIIIVHALYGLYNQCNYPLTLSLVVVLQNVFMLCLFGDFYNKNYVKGRRSVVSDVNKTK